MRIIAVIQARMSSSRFPGKMLAPLAGAPLIEVVCRRVRACDALDGLVVATSDRADDDPLAEAVERLEVPLYRGSLDNVLARMVGAARRADAEAVVRITGDCPLVDPQVLATMIRRFREGDLAYLSNVSPPSFPNGLDLEIVRLDALEAALAEATEAYQREHVTPFVRERPNRFPQGNFARDGESLYSLHWSVDRPEHLEVLEKLWRETGTAEPLLPDFLAVLERRPELAAEQHPERAHAGAIRTFLAEAEASHPLPSGTASEALWRRAGKSSGPRVLVRGSGSRVWDADGNSFLDLSANLAAVPLGHAHPRVIEAVTRQLAAGSPRGPLHPLAVELAERVCQQIPWAEWATFGAGGEALRTCIELARIRTGRQGVARAAAIADTAEIHEDENETTSGARSFPPGSLDALEALLTDPEAPLAAVVLEPIPPVSWAPEFLDGARELTRRHGALLVFDERATGFRPARGGAQDIVGVAPNLCVMDRNLANGLPLSMVAGSGDPPVHRKALKPSWEVSNLAAALATLDEMEREGFWSRVQARGMALQNGYAQAAQSFGLDSATSCIGLPFHPTVTFEDAQGTSATGPMLKALFRQEMLRRGILWSPEQPLTLAHDDSDIEQILDTYGEALRVLKFALELDAVGEMTVASRGETGQAK